MLKNRRLSEIVRRRLGFHKLCLNLIVIAHLDPQSDIF